VWVFALPDSRDLEELPDPRQSTVRVSSSSGRMDPDSATKAGIAAAPTAAAGRASLFSAAQAARGQTVFHNNCAPCHALADMTGSAFQAKWGADSLAALFTLISSTMPRNAPGSLGKEDYADVIGFLLRDSGYPAGPSDLPADATRISELRLKSKP